MGAPYTGGVSRAWRTARRRAQGYDRVSSGHGLVAETRMEHLDMRSRATSHLRHGPNGRRRDVDGDLRPFGAGLR